RTAEHVSWLPPCSIDLDRQRAREQLLPAEQLVVTLRVLLLQLEHDDGPALGVQRAGPDDRGQVAGAVDHRADDVQEVGRAALAVLVVVADVEVGLLIDGLASEAVQPGRAEHNVGHAVAFCSWARPRHGTSAGSRAMSPSERSLSLWS